jgi:uncharacterized protein YuzE
MSSETPYQKGKTSSPLGTKSEKMKKFQFNYDSEQDGLFLFSRKAQSEGGVELGPILLDFNSKDGLVGVELMHATEFLSSFLRLSKAEVRQMLKSLLECKVEMRIWGNHIATIQILLSSEKREETLWTLSVPQVQKAISPAHGNACVM